MSDFTVDERLGVLKAWTHERATDLEGEIFPLLNPFVARFMHALADAHVLRTDEALTAAEIALVELEADWGGK